MASGIEPCTNCRTSKETRSKCSRCGNAWYCSKSCQQTHWTVHKPVCRRLAADEVWALAILSKDEWLATQPGATSNDVMKNTDTRFVYKLIKTNHPVFSRGELCPVPAMMGIPLVIYSPTMHAAGVERAAGRPGSNHVAVQLRIEPTNAFAPPLWQINDPGTCILVRRDKKFLPLETAQAVFAYIKKLLDAAGYPPEDGWAPVHELMTPAAFQSHSRDYYEAQRNKGRSGFAPFWSPL